MATGITSIYSSLRRAIVLALACTLPLASSQAAPGCSRDIIVPVAPIGASVIINGDGIGGIYPDILRRLGAKAGCNFIFSAVPRARLEVLFMTGKADLLIPASSTPLRDRHGVFVPLVSNRPLLISMQGPRAPIQAMQDLIERRNLRVAVVRGYDYGDAYQELLKELTRQGRLFVEVDTLSVARLLQGGYVDATIMGPTIFDGIARADPRVSGMLDKLRLEALPELPWGLSGAYLSSTTLSARDAAAVRELLERAGKSAAIMEGFRRYHSQELLSNSIRPL